MSSEEITWFGKSVLDYLEFGYGHSFDEEYGYPFLKFGFYTPPNSQESERASRFTNDFKSLWTRRKNSIKIC